MDEVALIHVLSPLRPFARWLVAASFVFLAMASWPADHSWDSCGWQDDRNPDWIVVDGGWQDGSSSSSSGWQYYGGNGMYGGVQAAEGWGVRPGSGPQASKQLACRSQQQLACRPQQKLACRPQQQLACQSQQPIPEEQPLAPDELPGYLAGYKAGYDAAYEAGWEQGCHAGEYRHDPDAGGGAGPGDADQPHRGKS